MSTENKISVETASNSPVAHQRLVSRLGRFSISGCLLRDWQRLLPMMANFVIVRCEYLYHMDKAAYVAYSPLFEECPEYCEPPEYEIIVNDLDDKITVSARKSANE